MHDDEARMTGSRPIRASFGFRISPFLLVVSFFGGPGLLATESLERFEFAEPHMGTSFSLLFYASDQKAADLAAEAAFSRIRHLDLALSDYDADSELRRLCRTSGTGQAVRLRSDLWRMLSESQRLAEQSDGAFDVTIAPVVKLWRRARRTKKLPDADRLRTARSLVGYRFVELDPVEKTCLLKKVGMRLDLGAIAKGYAADEALAVLEKHGWPAALVNAGGDIALGDPPPGRAGWKIGISPLKPDSPASRYLLLRRCGIATSGDTWQYAEIDGQRYSHIIDPRTGLGLSNRSSVTVIAGDCATADSLASAVSVLGPQVGLEFLRNFSAAEAVIVYLENGKTKLRETQGVAKFGLEGQSDIESCDGMGPPALPKE